MFNTSGFLHSVCNVIVLLFLFKTCWNSAVAENTGCLKVDLLVIKFLFWHMLVMLLTLYSSVHTLNAALHVWIFFIFVLSL